MENFHTSLISSVVSGSKYKAGWHEYVSDQFVNLKCLWPRAKTSFTRASISSWSMMTVEDMSLSYTTNKTVFPSNFIPKHNQNITRFRTWLQTSRSLQSVCCLLSASSLFVLVSGRNECNFLCQIWDLLCNKLKDRFLAVDYFKIQHFNFPCFWFDNVIKRYNFANFDQVRYIEWIHELLDSQNFPLNSPADKLFIM